MSYVLCAGNNNDNADTGSTNNDTKHSTNDNTTYYNTDNDINGASKNNNNDKRYNRFSLEQPKEKVFILGDSMVKKIKSFLLTKNIRHKCLVKVRRFSSAKVRCM